jgi:hypothetical protein
MTKSFLGGPLILVIDDNPGRIEYLEHLLFQNGFQIHALSVDELKQGIGRREIDLVLSCLSIEPSQFTDRGIPVLFVLSGGASPAEHAEPINSMVAYLPASVGADALIEKLTDLTNR